MGAREERGSSVVGVSVCKRARPVGPSRCAQLCSRSPSLHHTSHAHVSCFTSALQPSCISVRSQRQLMQSSMGEAQRFRCWFHVARHTCSSLCICPPPRGTCFIERVTRATTYIVSRRRIMAQHPFDPRTRSRARAQACVVFAMLRPRSVTPEHDID